MCQFGWYDPGEEQCRQCHYTWLHFLLFCIDFKVLIKIIIAVMVNLIDSVAQFAMEISIEKKMLLLAFAKLVTLMIITKMNCVLFVLTNGSKL